MGEKKRFKDSRQQKVYEQTLALAASGLWIGGVLGEAFSKGTRNIPAQWPHTSMAYAAWRAGRDIRNKAEFQARQATR